MRSPDTDASSTSVPHFRVAVVGGGPVGLTAANLLAARGIQVVLIERNATTSDDAKAISMDAESVRALYQCGLGDRVRDIVLPGTGVRFHDRGGRRLFQARGTGPYVYGYAVKSQFSQPELERTLLESLRDRPEADIRLSTEVVSLTQNGKEVTLALRTDDGADELSADYVIGCDGGRSTVRRDCGITMSGRSFDDVWLVVDTVDDHHDDRCSMHFGDPARPRVMVPGRAGRCRYEFLLRPGEGAAGTDPGFALVQRLLAPYRDIKPEQVERAVTYRFHALLADRWRAGRVFLAGDSAHMMPPFAGQGLNSGVRDVANLCWKLALVADGTAQAGLLDTYESERRPHADVTVRASVRQGQIMMTTHRGAATARDVAVRALLRLPKAGAYLRHLGYLPRPRFTAGFVAPGASPLIGKALDQPRIQHPDGSEPRLDSVLGDDFALLGIDTPEDDWRSAIEALPSLAWRELDVVLGDRRAREGGPRRAVGDADGELERLLGPSTGSFVLLRPDRYVAAVFTAAEAHTVARALRAHLN
ncbi:bifunctional 3-(3-hydroxy-phenyl)propionate/3-hydroxycinnamic acid hydroxylase [Streptomyces sp. NPDC048445]|uniref:bifunctional 3-(3-hydroxy-phenyl)propionate/3-hydroxycinnamic acid hydroxylase n=1 Tax=Streptomyces sp. NPDC048445 TaxID=3365553 RepID=UPI0037177A09